jgi:hypothetical protein
MESSYFVGAVVILAAWSAMAQVPLVTPGARRCGDRNAYGYGQRSEESAEGGAGRRGDWDHDFAGRGELWR